MADIADIDEYNKFLNRLHDFVKIPNSEIGDNFSEGSRMLLSVCKYKKNIGNKFEEVFDGLAEKLSNIPFVPVAGEANRKYGQNKVQLLKVWSELIGGGGNHGIDIPTREMAIKTLEKYNEPAVVIEVLGNAGLYSKHDKEGMQCICKKLLSNEFKDYPNKVMSALENINDNAWEGHKLSNHLSGGDENPAVEKVVRDAIKTFKKTSTERIAPNNQTTLDNVLKSLKDGKSNNVG